MSSSHRYPGKPLLGALLDVRRDPMGTFARAAKLGDVVRMEFPGRVGFAVLHPDDVKHVLVDNHKNYGKQTRGYQMLRLALGQGLVTSEGEHWRRQRRIAQPAFHHQRIAAFGAIMTRAAEDMLASWDELARTGGVLEMHEAMMRVTFRIVGECLISTDLSDDSAVFGKGLATMLEETFRRVQSPFTLPLRFPTPANLRYRRTLARLDEVVLGVIRERVASSDRPPDLLTMFMEARDEETGAAMSEQHLRDEIFTIVAAGHETTAVALTWTFLLLSQHPEVAARLREELDRILGGRTPVMDDLAQLTYTEAVVKESMRIYPPVWMIARSATAPDEVGGVRVPPGAMIFLPLFLTHRDPRFWEKAGEFYPERWLGQDVERLPKHAYYPFAGGPRVCIGNSFAMMEARLILATVFSRFTPTLVPGHRVVAQPTVTLRPKYGMRMTLGRARV